MRITKTLSANETLKILDSQWLSTNDIRLLARVGLSKAALLKKEIEKAVKQDDPNYFLPAGLVPTVAVIDYLHININYLKKIAKE